MTAATATAADALTVPDFDPTDVTLNGARFHEVMADLAAQSWIARVPLGYVTLDRAAGEFFLRCREATFPGQLIAEISGVTTGPLREEIDNNILHLDGARHRRLRNLLNPFFTPRGADRWRPTMRELIADLADAVVPAGQGDVAAAIARPYPAQTIASVMGAPLEDAPRLAEWSHWMQSQFDAQSLLGDRDRIERAVTEFTDWCDALIARRRDDPADDLISLLLAAEPEGGPLTDVELRNLVLDVLAGGIDTTQAQLAHGIRLFAAPPEQWALLAHRPELLPAAVEEVIRHEPVTPFTARILTADIDYRGVRFAAGTVILVCAATGNRDGLADGAFDITAERDGARVMTFGAGIHFCVGANLARAELEEAFGHLAPRMPDLRLTGVPTLGTTQGIYDLPSLPVGWKTG